MTMARWIVMSALLVCATSAGAQPPASPPEAPAPPADYAYTPEGRRDPFVPAIGRRIGPPVARLNTQRPAGLAGVLVAEIVVRGLLESQGAWVAMVGAPDGRNYTLRAGDRVMDGTVREITADAVIFLQAANDQVPLAKQREVRKYLRGGEQAQ